MARVISNNSLGTSVFTNPPARHRLARIQKDVSRPHLAAAAANNQVQTLQNWDIVVLKEREDGAATLGRVVEVGDTTHTIEVLEQESQGEFIASGIERQIPAISIINIIDDYEYSQRQADRVHNPHGEHAEEVFTIPDISRYLLRQETE